MASNGLNFTPYDPNQPAATNAQNMIQNQNTQYTDFLNQLPNYQNNMNNQTVDQGNQQYNNQKSAIDTSANKRGLLYSGLKQGAEVGAANQAANQTQNGIVQNNANLSNYATGYGNQVANANISGYQNQVNTAVNNYQNKLNNYNQSQQGLGTIVQGLGVGAGLYMALAAKGGRVSGEAEHEGDNYENDHKIMLLSPGEIVIPRSASGDKDKSKKYIDEQFKDDKTVEEKNVNRRADIAKVLASILAMQSVMNKRKNKAGA